MEWLHSIILGIVQGVTEFLPISSSAHLILVPKLLGWRDQGLIFDIAANTGSLIAVMAYFWHDVVTYTVGFVRTLRPGGFRNNPEGHMAWALGWATIPIGLAGLTFKHHIETLARDLTVIGTTAIFFGLLLWVADRRGLRTRGLDQLTWRDAVLIGVAQMFALIPGTSRSGVTMTAALFSGFSREASARFAFLMAIPVGVLAAGLEFRDLFRLSPTPSEWMFMGLGLVVSGVSAFAVIHWLMTWLRQQSLVPFAIYRIVLGVVIFVLVYS
ncbi:MAG: undecaprenyl-diphosphate phosphatase [Magnetococcales bacterium]|nr:undecaprenyl-diphosphate phosphatase [Magnetococcales bacterium]